MTDPQLLERQVLALEKQNQLIEAGVRVLQRAAIALECIFIAMPTTNEKAAERQAELIRSIVQGGLSLRDAVRRAADQG